MVNWKIENRVAKWGYPFRDILLHPRYVADRTTHDTNPAVLSFFSKAYNWRRP